jgi:zinc transporter
MTIIAKNISKEPGIMQSTEFTYGSDKYGLIWGYLFEPGQPSQQMDTKTIVEWLTSPIRMPEKAFLWIHFSLSNSATEPWLQQHLRLPNTFYESFHESVGSTRLEQEDEALIAIIHDVMFDSSFDVSSISTVNLCVTPNLLITARRHPLRSVDHLRTSVKAGNIFRSPVELLSHLLRDQADVLVDIVRKSTRKVDSIEDRLLADRIEIRRSDLGSLRRVLVRLQRLLAPEPAAFFRLLNRPPSWICGEDLQDLRQAAEEFSAAVVDSAALTERVKLIQEELAALINEQTSRTLFILTVVTVMALPINLVAGLFGMNVGGIPFAQFEQGFLFIVGILILLTALIAYLAFGRKQ